MQQASESEGVPQPICVRIREGRRTSKSRNSSKAFWWQIAPCPLPTISALPSFPPIFCPLPRPRSGDLPQRSTTRPHSYPSPCAPLHTTYSESDVTSLLLLRLPTLRHHLRPICISPNNHFAFGHNPALKVQHSWIASAVRHQRQFRAHTMGNSRWMQ